MIFLLFLVAVSFTKDASPGSTDFKTQVNTFVKTQAQTFVSVPETFTKNGNDVVLDNRSSPTWSRRITLKSKTALPGNQTFYPQIYLSFYEYQDSAQCLAAQDSLMHCLGNDCAKVTPDDHGRSIKTTPFLYIINEKQIIACHLHCEHRGTAWEQFKNELRRTFVTEKSKLIGSECGGPLFFSKGFPE